MSKVWPLQEPEPPPPPLTDDDKAQSIVPGFLVWQVKCLPKELQLQLHKKYLWPKKTFPKPKSENYEDPF